MTKRIPNPAEMAELEKLIDRCGLFDVVVALSVICCDKAGLTRVIDADKVTAAAWDRASNVLVNVAKMPTIQKL